MFETPSAQMLAAAHIADREKDRERYDIATPMPPPPRPWMSMPWRWPTLHGTPSSPITKQPKRRSWPPAWRSPQRIVPPARPQA